MSITKVRHRNIETVFIVIFLALSFSCERARQPATSVVPGVTTLEQVKKNFGEPVNTSPSPSRPAAQILDYSGATGWKFQEEGGIIVATFRSPDPEESSIQYWRHKWKGAVQHYEAVPDSKDVHGNETYQLTAPSLGMAVTYDATHDRVTQVAAYAPR